MKNDKNISETTTAGIKVQVLSKYIPENTNLDLPKFFFAYWVTITNDSEITVKITERHWEITDAHGQTEIIDGEGVVGKQPTLKPGDSFSYNSFCPLKTEFGMMKGYYEVEREDGHFMKIIIPDFQLISPFAIN